jgi:hypothetical protein
VTIESALEVIKEGDVESVRLTTNHSTPGSAGREPSTRKHQGASPVDVTQTSAPKNSIGTSSTETLAFQAFLDEGLLYPFSGPPIGHNQASAMGKQPFWIRPKRSAAAAYASLDPRRKTASAFMPTLYLETSIVSYLRQQPSARVVTAARQLLTHQWWINERGKYDVVTSQYVIDEASDGAPSLAQDRLRALEGIPLLPADPGVQGIADEIMSRAILPPKAVFDALHIAIAAYHEIDYLLTWNCRHIANGRILSRVHAVLHDLAIPVPVICTPEELVEDDSAD